MDAGRHGGRVLLAGLALVAAAGCGGSDAKEQSISTPTAPAVPSSSPAAAVPTPTSGGATTCGSAKLEIQAGVQVTGYLDSVEVPTCAKALVKTSLTSSKDDVLSAVGSAASPRRRPHPRASPR